MRKYPLSEQESRLLRSAGAVSASSSAKKISVAETRRKAVTTMNDEVWKSPLIEICLEIAPNVFHPLTRLRTLSMHHLQRVEPHKNPPSPTHLSIHPLYSALNLISSTTQNPSPPPFHTNKKNRQGFRNPVH